MADNATTGPLAEVFFVEKMPPSRTARDVIKKRSVQTTNKLVKPWTSHQRTVYALRHSNVLRCYIYSFSSAFRPHLTRQGHITHSRPSPTMLTAHISPNTLGTCWRLLANARNSQLSYSRQRPLLLLCRPSLCAVRGCALCFEQALPLFLHAMVFSLPRAGAWPSVAWRAQGRCASDAA